MVKVFNAADRMDVLIHLSKSADDRLVMIDIGPFRITKVVRGAPGDANAPPDDPFEPPLTEQSSKPIGGGVPGDGLHALSSGKVRTDAPEGEYVISWIGSTDFGPHIEIDP
jgi:hypothetical protein